MSDEPNILIVDDDAVIRHLLVLQLDKLGRSADTAANGIEALRRIRNYAAVYRLIIMDIQMPEMDGFQTTASIRVEEKNAVCKLVPLLDCQQAISRKKNAVQLA